MAWTPGLWQTGRMEQASISDVARLAGVSDQTVERVINFSPLVAEDVRRKVVEAIGQAGFNPQPQPRLVAARHNRLVALVHDGRQDQAFLAAQAGLDSALAGSAYVICLQRLAPGARNAVTRLGDFLEFHRPAGMILMPALADQDRLAGLAWEYHCPCLRLSGAPGGTEPGWIGWPEREAAAQAVRRLAELGHDRIALISGAEDDPVMAARELGYLDAMAELGLDRGPSLIASGDGSLASGFEAASLLLDLSPAPSAVLACSDEMAAGAIAAAAARKVTVPGQLAVIGFGDTPLAPQLTPALTTVRIPLFEAAREAGLRILDPQRAAAIPSPLPAPLVERGSAGENRHIAPA